MDYTLFLSAAVAGASFIGSMMGVAMSIGKLYARVENLENDVTLIKAHVYPQPRRK